MHVDVITSITREDIPEIDGVIRSQNHLTGYTFEPHTTSEGAEGVLIEWVQNNDVKGSIWSCLLNTAGLRMQSGLFYQLIDKVQKEK